MPRRALLAKINQAWGLREAGEKRRSMLQPVDVQERQLGNYLDPRWVVRRGEFTDLGFNQWAELTPSLQKVHPRYAQFSQLQHGESRLNPVQQHALLERIAGHFATLKRTVHDLLDLQVFPTDAREIRQWFAWPTETSWPVSLGQAYREGIGKVWVKLNIEEQEVWKPVRQHLEGRPVLAAVEKWRRATTKDIAARLSLLDALLRYVETNTSLPVWVSVNEGDSKAEGLHNHYIDLIYDQVFRTAVNVGPALSAPVGGPLPLTREQFSLNGEGNLCHYNAQLIRGGAAAEREQALALLLEAHTRLADIPQALAAGRAYQEADTQTSQVRALRSEFLNSGLDLDSRCEECQPWYQALGVRSKGLGG